jgi:hypothetical protein
MLKANPDSEVLVDAICKVTLVSESRDAKYLVSGVPPVSIIKASPTPHSVANVPSDNVIINPVASTVNVPVKYAALVPILLEIIAIYSSSLS